MREGGRGGLVYTGAINFECVMGVDANEDVEEAIEEDADEEPDEREGGWGGGVYSPIEA